MPNDFALTPTDPRDAPVKSMLQQIDEFLSANVPTESRAQVGHFITKFIGTTKLAPTLTGEPVFVLRGQDRIAPFIVRKWADEAEAHGCPKDKVDGADRDAALMIAWQIKNPLGVKAPD